MKKEFMKSVLLLSLVFAAQSVAVAEPTKPRLGRDPLRRIVAAMTLEEKASFLVGASMEGYTGDGAVTGHTLKFVPGSAGTTCPLPAYGIPATVMADGPAGLRIDPHRDADSRSYFCTAFPSGTLAGYQEWHNGCGKRNRNNQFQSRRD